jgi:hypothetical protein
LLQEDSSQKPTTAPRHRTCDLDGHGCRDRVPVVNNRPSDIRKRSKKACIPRNADMNQMVDLFKNHVRDQPEGRHLLAAHLAADAFALAFP